MNSWSRLERNVARPRGRMIYKSRRIQWHALRPCWLTTRLIGFGCLRALAVVLSIVGLIRPVDAVADEPVTKLPTAQQADAAGQLEVPANPPLSDSKQPLRRPNVADIDSSRTTPKVVRVVDANEQPIAGARVRVGWWEDADGDILGVISTDSSKTDAAGEALLAVPLGAARALISAEAEGYAPASTQSLLSGSPKLKLEQGRSVQVKAVDESGNPLPNAYPLLQQSRVFGREFQPNPDRPGYFTSPVVALERRWMRVVDGSGEGPLRFSDLIDVTQPGEVQPDGTIVAVLRPGIRLQGRLGAAVPRPVSGGCVELYINEGDSHRIERGAGWTWEETAIVQEDGTFVFESLPRGGHVQLVALVDGFQSSKPTPESLRAYLRTHAAGDESLVDAAVERQDAFWPHLFSLAGDQAVLDVELPCTPTAALDVLVVDPLGSPIEGAAVFFNPNGYFLGGELFIPATQGFTSSHLLRPQRHAATQRLNQWAGERFLHPRTDSAGIAWVRNLPAGERESYRVEAEGYVMPVHPTSTSSTPESAQRYALVDLVGGETIGRTVTMEQFVPRHAREVVIVYRDAKPVEGMTVTLTEIALEDAPQDWALWSVQRFGEVATAETGADGIARLQVPTQVAGRTVAQLRVAIHGRIGGERFVRETLDLPAEADRRVVVLTPSEEPAVSDRFGRLQARYVDPATLLENTPAELLKRLAQRPSMALLQILLQQAEYDATTPLRFRADRNFLMINRSVSSPIAEIQTEQGRRVVVLCDVRPKDALWNTAPEGAFPPEAAFVFAPDGKLVNVIGGWASARGRYNNVMLANLGGTDDTFVQTSEFDQHGPFDYLQRWFRIGQEDSRQPALTVWGYANATSWSGRDGAAEPLAEFGYIEFGFNGKNLAAEQTGVVAGGAAAPRRLYWDGRRTQFIGPVSQEVDGRPLYQVLPALSAAFAPLDIPLGELVVGGGRRDFKNWHYWDVVIPAGKTARLTFTLEQHGEETLVTTELHSETLKAGWHPLQLQLEDSQDDEASSMLHLRTRRNSSEQSSHRIPRVPIAEVPSVEDAAAARTGTSELILLRRATQQEGVWLVGKLTLP